MKKSLALLGAMLSLAAFASTADAGMAGVNMTTSIGRTDTRIPLTTSIGSIRTNQISSHGLEVHKHSHRRDTEDKTDGEQPDPPKTGGTGGTGANNVGGGTYPSGPKFPDWQKKHGGYGPGPHVNWTPEPPLACKGRPGGC